MMYQGVISLSFFLLTLPFSLSNLSLNPTSFRVDLHHPIERSISRHNALQWAISIKYSPSDLKTEIKQILGDDLMWNQCEPCEDCFNQDEEIFDPQHSCSYVELDHTSLCRAYHQSTPTENPSPHEVSYTDKSQSKGVPATESTFETSRAGTTQTVLSGIGFGCGHETLGKNKDNKRSEQSNLPLLKLEDISVGDKRLNIPPETFDSRGFIIDSGSTLSYLASEGYGLLTDELKAMIQLEAANEPPHDPSSKISPQNFFPAMSEDMICSPTEEVSIMGNLAQQDMAVQFDVKDNMLSFTPAACTIL
ncbi:hypothetical protein AMTRI_Chr01g128180 [Amborella trichopoda]